MSTFHVTHNVDARGYGFAVLRVGCKVIVTGGHKSWDDLDKEVGVWFVKLQVRNWRTLARRNQLPDTLKLGLLFGHALMAIQHPTGWDIGCWGPTGSLTATLPYQGKMVERVRGVATADAALDLMEAGINEICRRYYEPYVLTLSPRLDPLRVICAAGVILRGLPSQLADALHNAGRMIARLVNPWLNTKAIAGLREMAQARSQMCARRPGDYTLEL